MRKLAAFAALIALVSPPLPARAHESHGSHRQLVEHFLSENESARALETHLSDVRESMIREGRLALHAEEARAGRLLADAVAHEWKLTLEGEVPPSALSRLAGGFREHVLDRINPVRIGRWVIELARARGIAIAVVIGVTELIEQAGILYGSTHLEHAYLVPLSAIHFWDFVGIGIAYGVPEGRRLLRTWKRLGGVRATLHHWVRHRAVQPLDWANLVNVSDLPGAPGDAPVAIRVERALDRWMPRSLKLALRPARAAAEGTVSLSIAELERLASRHGLDVSAYSAFRSRPAIHSTLLLREITGNFEAHEALLASLRDKGLSGADPGWLAGIDLRAGLDLAEADAVARFREAGLTADLLAERYSWHYRFRLKTYLLLAADLTGRERREAIRRTRGLREALEARGGVEELAASRAEAVSFESVLREARKLEELVASAARDVPALASGLRLDCARLLR